MQPLQGHSSALRAATKLRIELPKPLLHARGREIGFRAHFLICFKILVFAIVQDLFPPEAMRSEGREALCLPNLLAGGLPAGALPGLALAADKRAQHTHATQKSTAHARHTKRDVWVCTGEDMKEAIEMGGRRCAARRAPLRSARSAAPRRPPSILLL